MNGGTIGLTPEVHGVGGMVSFRHKLAAGLAARGIGATGDLEERSLSAVLVIGGTRDLAALRRLRRRGVRIVQRLDGINWIHRRRRTGLRHFVRAEAGNWLLRTIRDRYADGIVYQSDFSKAWWERVYGAAPAASVVIRNAVDLEVYTPNGPGEPPEDEFRLLLVEGSLQGGYETGLSTAIELANRLDREVFGKRLRLSVAGKVGGDVQKRHSAAFPSIEWLGLVPPERIPELDRSAHLLFSADLNPACPNSVIEALACGLPVAAFDTGALGELVGAEAGAIVPYGGDPWRIDPPDVAGLAEAAVRVLADQPGFRRAARQRAEEMFNLERMVAGYLDFCLTGS